LLAVWGVVNSGSSGRGPVGLAVAAMAAVTLLPLACGCYFAYRGWVGRFAGAWLPVRATVAFVMFGIGAGLARAAMLLVAGLLGLLRGGGR
jgi:hypothetical protein